MNLRTGLALSTILHALVTALLLAGPQTKPPAKPAPLQTPPTESIAIELNTPAASSGGAKTNSKPQRPFRNAKNSERAARLQNLLGNPYNSARPAPDGSVYSRRLHSGAWDEGAYGAKDDPSTAWGSGSGNFQRVQDLVLMKRFQEKVEALLFYPDILARRQISGTVTSRLVLSEDGNCDWERTQISSTNAYFRVYILHVLKNVCSENFKKYTHAREMTNLDMSFDFVVSEDYKSKDAIAENEKVVGNVLLFYRHSRHSAAEWRLGPFTGMFPIPFVALDFAYIQEHFDSLVYHIDPLKGLHAREDGTIAPY